MSDIFVRGKNGENVKNVIKVVRARMTGWIRTFSSPNKKFHDVPLSTVDDDEIFRT